MTTLDLSSALVRLSHLVQHVFDDASRDHDLTPQQAHLMCLLVDGPVGMTRLRRLLNLEKSSLTGLVDRTARRALVTRIPDPGDQRACRIALTPSGERLAVATHDDVIARLDKLVEQVAPDGDPGLTAFITRLLAARGLT